MKLNDAQPVSAWMGDHLQTGKLSRYVTSHTGQLSLAIPPWVLAKAGTSKFQNGAERSVAP